MNLDLFLPLAKVDVDQRTVQGVATAERPDRAGEICDYASTKPYFEAWSAEAEAASGGKSLGAVRAMHGRVAAGKLTDISFDDEGKRILVAAKIVDDDEWQKVLEGVYTGFSQGGRYVKRWDDSDTGLTRYTAKPTEISLVDLPCLPDATFEVVKDGVVEKRAFARPVEGVAPAPGGEAAIEEAPTTPEPAAQDIAASPPAIAESAPEPAPLPSPIDALGKAALALSQAADRLERAVEANERLRKTVADIAPNVGSLEKRIAAIEAQPTPARAALRGLSRDADLGGTEKATSLDAAIKEIAGLPEEKRALALMKVSLRNPVTRMF